MSFRRRRRWLRRLALGLTVVTVAAALGVQAAAAKRDDGPGTAVYVSGEAPLPSRGDAARPDDAAARFAHSDVANAPVVDRSTAWTFERSDALILAIGALALAFGLAFALGFIHRPRLAGL